MIEPIYLTEHFTLVTSDGMYQPLWKGLDVSRFDVLNLILITAFDRPTSGSINVSIFTGMQRQSTDNLALAGSFPAASPGASTGQRLTLTSANNTGFLRYVFWHSSGLGANAVRLMIYGTGRTLGNR